MKWCLQCGKPNYILNETCEECDNPNFYDPNAKAGDAEIKSLRAERDNLAAANAELREALENLLHRLDSHFGGADKSQDWKEQAEARAVLAKGAK